MACQLFPCLLQVCSYPCRLQKLLGRGSLSYVTLKHFFYKLFGRMRHIFPLVCGKLHLAVFNRLQHIQVFLSLEWQRSAQKNVEHDSRGPNITFLIVFPFEDFGSNVIGLNLWKIYSSDSFSFSQLAVLKLRGWTQIDQFNGVGLGIDDDILRFEVSIHWLEVTCA